MRNIKNQSISWHLMASLFFLHASFCAGFAADWPQYLHDAFRSGRADSTKLELPLYLQWKWTPSQRPCPAWPEPGNERHRMDFDYTFQPVVSNGLVYFGSSSDDTLRVLDLETGKLRWRFTSGGPLRFAPTISNGKCFVSSDDGVLYALNAETGKEVWRFRCALNDRMLLGNGRVISRWPMRSGIAVDKGTLYCVAGMWPSEGVLIYALEANSGKILWCNDTSGQVYTMQPHGAPAMSGAAPQGYVTLTREALVVPTGRGKPVAFDRRSGVRLPLSKNGALAVRAMLTDKKRGRYGRAWIGKIEFLGLRDALAAHVDGRSVWNAPVDAPVRGIVSGSGFVVAATESGAIYAFSSKPTAKVRMVEPAPVIKSTWVPSKPALKIFERIKTSGNTKGYALVLADDHARLGSLLASQTDYHVIVCMTDASKVAAVRRHVLKTTNVYGSRVWVTGAGTLAHLPPCFANVIVVASRSKRVSGTELLRILRPSGGKLWLLETPPALENKLASSASDYFLSSRKPVVGGVREYVRGKLPGAFDWNSKNHIDHRVRWPLEVLWFGGPGPARMIDRHRGRERGGAPTPLAAGGRMFVMARNNLIALDAYNGCELWSRSIKKFFVPGPFQSKAMIWGGDDACVYLLFKKRHYVQLDAETGRVKAYYKKGRSLPAPAPAPSPSQFELNKPLTFRVGNEGGRGGTGGAISVRGSSEGLHIDILSEGTFMAKDGWDLFFDFRPSSHRFGLYEPGAFQLIIDPDNAHCSIGAGPVHPKFSVTKRSSLDGEGSKLTVNLSWSELERVAPGFGESFSFAFRLHQFRKKSKRTTFISRFCDDQAEHFIEGWATIKVSSRAQSSKASTSSSAFAIKNLNELPLQAKQRTPSRERDWNAFKTGDLKVVRSPRIHPLTGRKSIREYRRAYGCGGVSRSATLDFFRSGTVGIYALDDDSGMRSFGGIKPSCGISLIPALGLLLSPEGSSGCGCGYNYQTSLALVPATRRSHEDWAVFFGPPAAERIRHVALNFGAPGDRRESTKPVGFNVDAKAKAKVEVDSKKEDPDAATLWLGLPREKVGKRLRMPLPVELIHSFEFETYHFNADRNPISNTQQPWLYTSGCRGLYKAAIELLPENISSGDEEAHRYTVRLHFAEPDAIPKGTRVFDVLLQGKVVLKDFDIVREAGRYRRALIKTFSGIQASGRMELELKSKVAMPALHNVPVICAFEIHDEAPLPVPEKGDQAMQKVMLPSAALPQVEIPPKVDGRLDDLYRKHATVLTFTHLSGKKSPLKFKTTAYLLRDATSMYVLAYCETPAPERLLAKRTRRDGGVWQDECIELFIDTGNLREETYYHIMINSIGVTQDARNKKDISWNPALEVACGKEEGKAWIMELRIPFSEIELNGKNLPSEIAFNILRTAHDPNNTKRFEESVWSPTYSRTSHAPARFGRLLLAPKGNTDAERLKK